jgi:hypothetical protein
MLDFRTGQIFGLLVRTLPFLALRIAVYVGITLAYVLAVGVGGGFGYLFGKIGGNTGAGAGWGGLVGFGIVSGLLYWARQYLLYLVKAGHVAVLVELLDGREIPGGKNQIDFATNIVKQHFATSSVLFGLNQLIRGILRAFNRILVADPRPRRRRQARRRDNQYEPEPPRPGDPGADPAQADGQSVGGRARQHRAVCAKL